MNTIKNIADPQPDIILIGAGIMSATLGMLLKELEPGISIAIFERLDAVAAESSDAWNNAGTGHSAFCELNYTPQQPDGSVDISKAIKIAASFEVSKQYWSYLVQQKYISTPQSYISNIPHLSSESNCTGKTGRIKRIFAHSTNAGLGTGYCLPAGTGYKKR